MNITIVNGSPDNSWNEFEKELKNTCLELTKEHNVDLFNIREMNIKYCVGCFSCWVKTPGLCVVKDDMEEILKSIAKTDYLIYVSPLVTGFISSETKKVMDRIIPTALPYIRTFNGECHHIKRYDKDMNLGILLFDDDGLDQEGVDITFSIIDRLGLNFHAPKVLKATAKKNKIKEVISNEIRNC